MSLARWIGFILALGLVPAVPSLAQEGVEEVDVVDQVVEETLDANQTINYLISDGGGRIRAGTLVIFNFDNLGESDDILLMHVYLQTLGGEEIRRWTWTETDRRSEAFFVPYDAFYLLTIEMNRTRGPVDFRWQIDLGCNCLTKTMGFDGVFVAIEVLGNPGEKFRINWESERGYAMWSSVRRDGVQNNDGFHIDDMEYVDEGGLFPGDLMEMTYTVPERVDRVYVFIGESGGPAIVTVEITKITSPSAYGLFALGILLPILLFLVPPLWRATGRRTSEEE